MVRSDVIRVTAVPRGGFSNSGLLAMRYAKEFGDEIWVIPGSGRPLARDSSMRFFALDRDIPKRILGVKIVRYLSLMSVFARAITRPRALFLVHSFIFSIPLFLLGRRYCIFIHGSDRSYLSTKLGRMIARRAYRVFGIGFGLGEPDLEVLELPNLFRKVSDEGRSLGAFDVIFVLRNAAVKNPGYPICLAENVATEAISIGVLGISENELSGEERKRVESARRSGASISYLGRCAYGDVVSTMIASRVLMIPSFSEGIPKVLLEAASQGMRVIINCQLTLPRDVSALAQECALDDWDTIVRSISAEKSVDPHLRLERAAKAEAYIQDSERCIYSAHAEIYASVAGIG